MLHRLLYSSVLPALLLLCACQGYDYTVNDKIVYAPNPLFRDFTTPDPGLKRCLEQAINDGVIRSAEQLTTLDCSYGGIESLEGLSVFTSLTELRLSHNKVRNLVELNRIASLQVLYLDENQVIDPVPLYQMSALRQVDLTGNPGLQCPQPGGFAQAVAVVLPEHCR